MLLLGENIFVRLYLLWWGVNMLKLNRANGLIGRNGQFLNQALTFLFIINKINAASSSSTDKTNRFIKFNTNYMPITSAICQINRIPSYYYYYYYYLLYILTYSIGSVQVTVLINSLIKFLGHEFE